jgi:peptidoglycan-N-acetylglucosamine deacetylase
VTFLASGHASWINGHTIAVTGSRLARRRRFSQKPEHGRQNMSELAEREPWQWPETHWRGLVNHVRAGRAYRPKAWKDGARCAFALSFDSDHETNELRDGGKSIGRMAWGQYGHRVGVPNILKMLAKHSVTATFYVPGVVAILYPDEQRRVAAEGHEVGIHSWIHELNSILPYDAEKDLMLRAADVLEKTTQVRPVGVRTASWDFSPHTLQITKEMGLLYDSSLMADVDCYELVLDGEPTGVIELPVEWIRDDAPYFMMQRFQNLRPYTPPADVFDIFRREFEAAYEEGGIFQLTCHPHIIGYRSRIWIIDELIRLAKTKGDVWFATHADVVRFAQNYGLTEKAAS